MYQFNNFTGRLIGSNAVNPYYPIGVMPLNKNDPPKIVFENPRVMMAQVTTPSRSASGGNVPEALLKKMKQFQAPNGLPVHLKGGPLDKVLFGVTFALCGIGIAATLQLIYVLSFPKKA